MCILLVVTWHLDINNVLYFTPKLNGYFASFRMPLYYILSGLFVSFSSGYAAFFQKKINRLIVPYCFFNFISNLLFWIAKDLMHGYEKGYFLGAFEWMSPLQVAFYRFPDNFNNMPIWFLISLFNAYMFYMLVTSLSRDKIWIKGILSFAIGICGYLLKLNDLLLPFYLDSAMYAAPFIFIGELFRKYTKLLTGNSMDKWNIPISLLLFVVLIFTSPDSYEQKANIIQYYFNGIAGTVAILLLCKSVKHIPVVSFLGRYSIIILGLHGMMIGKVMDFTTKVCPNLLVAELIAFTIIISICLAGIIVLKKFLPWFVAQKDLISFPK